MVLILPYINSNLSQVYMSSPSFTPSHLLTRTISLVIPVQQRQASCIMHGTWTGDSFHIWYYTCFIAILPNHPTLSHRVSAFLYAVQVCHSFSSKEQAPFNFLAAVIIHSDFGAQAFLGSKITVNSDCSNEIKRHLFLGRKGMRNLDGILKNRDITLLTKVCIVKAMFLYDVRVGR